MRVLRGLLRLAIGAFGLLVIARWAAIRVRQVLLLPTGDSTPPIGPGEVARHMRRVVVSDLHLGMGDRLDDFGADHEFAAFVRSYVLSAEPTELILAGDTF